MEKEMIRVITEYAKGFLSEKDIVDWAIHQMMNGKETISLVLLAGLNNNEYDDVEVLFKKSLSELGFNYPNNIDIDIEYARIIAEKILNKEINANEGCSIIGRICADNMWPQVLSEFGLLSHEQNGHENIGITKENIIHDICKAAEKLLYKSE